jgi:hypothetical protein
MSRLRIAVIGVPMLALGPMTVKAQIEPPVRLIERPAAPSGPEHYYMVTSDDGQIVAINSSGPIGAPNFPVLPITAQVLVIDRRQGTVELASRTPTGGFQNSSNPPGNFGSDRGPLSISRDGRYVAFVSSATNLDPAANTPGSYTYLYDRATLQVRVLTADGVILPGWRGGAGLIDRDATNLIFACLYSQSSPVSPRLFSLCRRRLSDGSTRVIVSGLALDNVVGFFQLSGDGRKILYSDQGPILTNGAPNPQRFSQLYLVDIASGAIELVSAAPDGTPGDGFSGEDSTFALSEDADFVAFRTSASNLAPGLAPGSKIVVTQRSTGVTKRASSVNFIGVTGPHLSADGRRLVYFDYAFYFSRDLIRLYDWETNSNRAIATPPGGLPNERPCRADMLIFGLLPRDKWQSLAISGDGRTAVFASDASNLFPGDTPSTCDLFVQNLGAVPQPAMPVPSLGPRWSLLAALLLALVGLLALRGGLSPR